MEYKETKETLKASNTKPPLFKSIIALYLWIGMIQFNILVLVVAFFLPIRIGASILALLVLLRLIPINPKSKFGTKVARFISKNAYGYFPITVHLEDENAFDPDQAYVFGYEPHTIFALGAWALTDRAGMTPLPKIKFMASSLAFNIPVLRHIWTWLGCVPVTRKSFIKHLAAGTSCITVPGGVQETIYLERDSEVAFLNSRKGFIKLAIEMGSPLVPVFCFGQSQAYKWWKPNKTILKKVYNAIKYPLVLYWGRFGSPIPFRVPMHIVIGKPIQFKKNPKPTSDEGPVILRNHSIFIFQSGVHFCVDPTVNYEIFSYANLNEDKWLRLNNKGITTDLFRAYLIKVNEVHAQYVAAMQELFEKNKAKYGSKDLQLKLL